MPTSCTKGRIVSRADVNTPREPRAITRIGSPSLIARGPCLIKCSSVDIEIKKLPSNRGTTNGEERKSLKSPTPYHGATISGTDYVVIATSAVVKRARIMGKRHSTRECSTLQALRHRDALILEHDLPEPVEEVLDSPPSVRKLDAWWVSPRSHSRWPTV